MIELSSLLRLVRAILSGEISQDGAHPDTKAVIDGVAQLNDVFEENGLVRLTESALYFTDDYFSSDRQGGAQNVEIQVVVFPTPLQREAFISGLRVSPHGAWWEKLEEIGTIYLARNADNHHLLDGLTLSEIQKLLGAEYENYLRVLADAADACYQEDMVVEEEDQKEGEE